MKKIVLGFGALALILGGLGMFAGTADAYRGDPSIKGPNYSPEKHEEMIKAFETNDYATWSKLMEGRGRITEIINEGNFTKFAEAHKLAMEGKFEEARQIRTELGLGLKDGSGRGQRMGMGKFVNQ